MEWLCEGNNGLDCGFEYIDNVHCGQERQAVLTLAAARPACGAEGSFAGWAANVPEAVAIGNNKQEIN